MIRLRTTSLASLAQTDGTSTILFSFFGFCFGTETPKVTPASRAFLRAPFMHDRTPTIVLVTTSGSSFSIREPVGMECHGETQSSQHSWNKQGAIMLAMCVVLYVCKIVISYLFLVVHCTTYGLWLWLRCRFWVFRSGKRGAAKNIVKEQGWLQVAFKTFKCATIAHLSIQQVHSEVPRVVTKTSSENTCK